jgi:hypothetical protein
MPGLEQEIDTERSKTAARWFAIIILAALLAWYRQKSTVVMDSAVFVAIVGGITLINVAHSFYLFRASSCPPSYKYISVGLDLLFLTATIRYTGFNESPFFFVYFVVLVSNCIRYGLLMSLYIAVLVNVLYTAVLAVAPYTLKPTVIGGEGLKLLAFWGVALYGGAVAARIRRQAYEIEAYEETIQELKEEVRKLRGGSAGKEPVS